MSRTEWERGSVKLPSAAWPKLKQALREGFNTEQQRSLARALEMYEQMVLAGEGHRNFDYPAYLDNLCYGEANNRRNNYGWHPDEGQVDQIHRVLLTENKKPRRPLAKDFPLANGKTNEFRAGYEAFIGISADTRSIEWSTAENNHAVDTANATNMAKLLFGLLAKVVWTRGTGGTFVGNDEYNQDSRDQGGGSNYVTRRFGPLGKQTVSVRRGFVR